MTLPKAPRPAKGSAVEIIDLAWYGRGGQDVLARFAAEATSSLPEVIPRRFGEWEPLKSTVAEAGLDAMESARQRAGQDTLLFSCAYPGTDGAISTVAGEAAAPRQDWMLRVALVATAFTDPAWQERLVALFTQVAGSTNAWYARAQVTAGGQWSGTRVTFTASSERTGIEWTSKEGFLGLPQQPTWLIWFGPAYRPLVADRLDRPPSDWTVTSAAGGTLVQLADHPATLRGLRPHVLGRPVPGGWFGSSLLVRGNRDSMFSGLKPASTLPS
jgi:hypothetical protein